MYKDVPCYVGGQTESRAPERDGRYTDHGRPAAVWTGQCHVEGGRQDWPADRSAWPVPHRVWSEGGTVGERCQVRCRETRVAHI